MPYNIDVPKSKKQRRLNFIITIILKYFIDISPSYECISLFFKAGPNAHALQNNKVHSYDGEMSMKYLRIIVIMKFNVRCFLDLGTSIL